MERSGTRRICWVRSSFHPTYKLRLLAPAETGFFAKTRFLRCPCRSDVGFSGPQKPGWQKTGFLTFSQKPGFLGVRVDRMSVLADPRNPVGKKPGFLPSPIAPQSRPVPPLDDKQWPLKKTFGKPLTFHLIIT